MSDEKDGFTEDDIGTCITIKRQDGTYIEAEIVRVFCPSVQRNLSGLSEMLEVS